MITFTKLHPHPTYVGPVPVYASFRWASGVDCLVRRNGRVWETAPVGPLHLAKFTPSPVAGASSTRRGAVMAFDFYYRERGET